MEYVRVLLLLALIPVSASLDNGLLRTPPMGWMAWERFRCDIDCNNDPENCISEKLFRDMADRLSEDGWRELGYEYVMIDDCWMSMQRGSDGRLQPDPTRFPGGIANLAKYIHNRGLKLGIYADMGSATCMGYPGTTLDKVEIDAKTFASWGVDYLKFDGCNSNVIEQLIGYPLMSMALNATGRPIAYSCSWPAYVGGLPPKVNYYLLRDICNVWRNFDDIQDSWDSMQSIINWFSTHQDDLQPAAGPGGWNDPDMLIIGNFGLSVEQARTQMALWAIMAAPLIMSNDLRSLSNDARAILQNRAAIAINQDPRGIQGRRLLQVTVSSGTITDQFKPEKSRIEVYWRPLSHSANALVFLSRRQDMPYLYHSSLAKLNFTAGSYEAYDVFSGKTTTGLTATTEFKVSINPSGVVMWYVYPAKQSPKDTGRYPYMRRKNRLSSFGKIIKPSSVL
ncbi:Alpha-N-acetylgalactosaminidase [Merluccius polli]|uniref:Alpha-galactosidase n=1 Tax=Merluccius polli TaxID=89951 RepID=A0AA47M100_MERPO|nr:Alpha-N-acetylgalactosaminidase [Merluccius polli]